MAASALTGGGRVTIRLHEIPATLRIQVAHELAARWKLTGMDYALFLLAAETPREDPGLRVPVEKAEMVMAGKRPPGSTPVELALPPVSV